MTEAAAAFGLSRPATHRSTVPHVQIGFRLIASSTPAATTTIRIAASAVRWDRVSELMNAL